MLRISYGKLEPKYMPSLPDPIALILATTLKSGILLNSLHIISYYSFNDDRHIISVYKYYNMNR